MHISKHGQKMTIPLDVTKGIQTLIQPEPNDSGEESEDQVNTAYQTSLIQQEEDLENRTSNWRQFSKASKGKKPMPLRSHDQHYPYLETGEQLVMEPEVPLPNTNKVIPFLFEDSDEEWMSIDEETDMQETYDPRKLIIQTKQHYFGENWEQKDDKCTLFGT
jgi:hypothetical protein